MSKYIFIVIVLIALAATGRILYVQLNTSLAPVTEIQSLTTILAPLTVAQPTYAVNLEASDLPTTVPLYETTTLRLAEINSQVSKWFGFTASPVIRRGGTGAFSVWNDADRSLIIGRKPTHIAFKKTPIFALLPRLTLSDEVFTGTAEGFLQQTAAVKTPFAISAPTKTYLEPRSTEPLVVDRAQATVIRLAYPILLDGKPLIGEHPANSQLIFEYIEDKTLIAATLPFLPEVKKLNITVDLITVNEAEMLLKQGEGFIISISRRDQQTTLIEELTLGEATVTSINLGYVFSGKTPLLQPAYVFVSTAINSANGEEYLITTVVDAVK